MSRGKSRGLLESPIDDRLLEGFYKPVRAVVPRPAAAAPVPGPAAVSALGPTAVAADAETAPPRADTPPARPPRPTHYKVCCISLYTEDIERLEAMVKELKRRGHTRANKSQLIRAALDQVDLTKIPKHH